MSSRALRKLKGDDLKIIDSKLKNSEKQDTDSKSEHVDLIVKHKTISNPFDLLNEESDSEKHSDTEEVEDFVKKDQSENDKIHSPMSQKNLTKKKRKKKKKAVKDEPPKPVDIEETIREVNFILGEPQRERPTVDAEESIRAVMKSLLAVEHKNLNPDNEMRRMFGSRVVQGEQQRRQNRHSRRSIKNWLVKPKDNWPQIGKSGISMVLQKTVNGNHYFNFEHSKNYQQVQFQFLDAVESLNPQNIMDILKTSPSHIDSLLQLSEICKMSEDIQMAAELMERALHVFESNFHTLYSLTQGNCRLDYRRPENRAYFLALFRQMGYVGRKGCYRTALELCKVILGLDVDEDPMAIALMIDFYALRSEEYNYLIRMYHEWGAYKNLWQLPNFAFSVPLAMFHHSVTENMGTSSADGLLQNALIMFPGVLFPLLEACSVQPDKIVTSHTFFNSTNEPDALKILQTLYIARCHPCWKSSEVMTWLETNVKEVLKRVDSGDPLINDYASKRATRYQGTPRNIYRHIIISEIKEATATLPPHIATTAILSYDPLPPTDSIVSYTRPERMRVGQQGANPLSLFFRSLLPNYDPQQILDDIEGAAGGNEVDHDGQNLRQGVGALMHAMRDLLNNIQPVPPPVENGHDNDNNENEEIDEWD